MSIIHDLGLFSNKLKVYIVTAAGMIEWWWLELRFCKGLHPLDLRGAFN